MSMPLQVLPGLAADFDGDCLNVMYITNQEFANRAMETFNPHNSMIISANDGLLNSQVNLYKDILITSNDLLGLSRDAYTDQDKAEIEAILSQA
jgi:hypothetical protein